MSYTGSVPYKRFELRPLRGPNDANFTKIRDLLYWFVQFFAIKHSNELFFLNSMVLKIIKITKKKLNQTDFNVKFRFIVLWVLAI